MAPGHKVWDDEGIQAPKVAPGLYAFEGIGGAAYTAKLGYRWEGASVIRTLSVAAALAAAVAVSPAAAAQACQLLQVAELKVEMMGTRPVMPAEINGQKVLMLIDTGATSNSLLTAQARRLGVKGIGLENVTMHGVGGGSGVAQATIEDFKLGDLPLKNVPMLVSGEAPSMGHPDLAGVIGASVFSKFDVDFDVSGGVIRLYSPKDCKASEVVYWNIDHFIAPLRPVDSFNPQFETEVELNGRKTRALIDTGASTSVVTLTAAQAAGVTPRSPGVTPDGESGGSGARSVKTWVGRFDTFAIGAETIRNARLRMADLFQHNTEEQTGSRVNHRVEGLPTMLLGADFFRSHRVLISNSQRRVLIAYKGGPVFSVSGPPVEAREEP